MRGSRLIIKQDIAILSCILLLMNKCFYLLPNYFFINILNPELFAVLISFVWLLSAIPRNFSIHSKFMGLYIGAFILVITSSIQASILYSGQSVVDGVMCQKYLLSGVFLALAISLKLQNGKFQLDEVMNVFFTLAILQIAIYFIQFVLGPSHIFLNCYYTTPAQDSSVNRVRLYGTISNLSVTAMYSVVGLGNPERQKKSIFYLIVYVLFLIVVNQGRGALTMTIAAICIGLVFMRGGTLKRCMALIALIIVIAFFLNSDFAIQLQQTLLHTTVESHSSYAVRLRAQAFYLDVLTNHPFGGGGYPDASVSSAYIGSGAASGIFAVDNGIYGFVFRYGLVGITWLIYFSFAVIRNGIQLWKQSGDFMPFMVLLPITMGYLTSASWYDGFGIFYTCFYLVYAESKWNQICSGKERH